jgi:signal transduction histidine kinase
LTDKKSVTAGSADLHPRNMLSLRRRVIIAISVIAFIVIAATVAVSLKQRTETLVGAERQLTTISKLTAERTSQAFAAADLLARSIQALAMKKSVTDDEALEVRTRAAGFHTDLVGLQRLLPQVDSAAVVDADGHLLATSRAIPVPAKVAVEPYFFTLKQNPELGLVVSEPVFATIPSKWMIYLARPLMADGKFIGAAVVGLPVEYFETYFSTIDIGPSQSISLSNKDNILFALWPRIADRIGKPLYGASSDLSLPGSRLVTRTSSKGDDWIVARTSFMAQETPFWIGVAQPRDAILQPWRRSLIWIVFFALINLAILGLLAGLILRAVHEEERWSTAILERETRLSTQAVELALARDVAETANRVRGEFLANMSHELRTPLNAVLGFSELLEKELFGPLGDPRYNEFVRDIYSSGKHLLEIIGNILDLAKVDAGKLEIYEEEVDIEEVMRGCIRLMRDSANASGVTMELRLPLSPLQLRADPTRLRQILLNLLSNAVKFSAGGTRVLLTAEEDEGGLVLKVIDHGIGMTAEEAVLAMEPFQQIDNSFSRRYQGTGLGLPLTKSLIDLHGGGMEIESAPGQGTTVTVILPKWRILRSGVKTVA